jgi:hypothetical protein
MKLLLDRWQFGVTITYQFLFVPLTIGLAFLVAIMQVLAYRRRDEVWERLTRFLSLAGPARDCGYWTSRPPAWTRRPAAGDGTQPYHRRDDRDHRHA